MPAQTVRQKLEDILVNQFIVWPKDAATILDEVIERPDQEAMRGRWNDPIAGYPTQMYAVWSIVVVEQAIAWLKKNKPQSVALRMLEASAKAGE